MMRTNMISLLMNIILELAQEESPETERVTMVVDKDGYRNIAGFKNATTDPEKVEIAFRAYTFDGSEWSVEQVEANDGTHT